MKSLKEFKEEPLIEEEKTDYSKFDTLVRAGLANKAQMQRIHRILDKMQEERPQFNNADKAILQNLFNKMVDLISNNKMINQQARKVVREDIEIDEDSQVVNTADFKISPSGRKVRAHRFKVGEKIDSVTEETLLEAHELPNILVLRRVSVRMYPNNTKIALYHSQKLDKYFSVPYGPDVMPGSIQAEETEQIDEAVHGIEQLRKIHSSGQHGTVNHRDGSASKVDTYTASAILAVHDKLNDDNKKKLNNMVSSSHHHMRKAADFAFNKMK